MKFKAATTAASWMANVSVDWRVTTPMGGRNTGCRGAGLPAISSSNSLAAS